jgi:carboxypeptidase Q
LKCRISKNSKRWEQKILQAKSCFLTGQWTRHLINTFAAYGGAGDQRSQGAAQAARFGAVGVVVRSLTTASDNFPHTGVMRYIDTIPKIPAVAISTKGADLLSGMLKNNPETQFSFSHYLLSVARFSFVQCDWRSQGF